MASNNRLFEDFARVAQGAAGALVGLRDELETRIKDQVDRVLSRMNLVRREEFEAVQAMAAKARREQEALTARLDALEGRTGGAARKTGSGRAHRNAGARGKSR
ncbi:MAG: accessory factor UbiK family protein [Alphaproteobacteria bacterium]|nr:accessory factor UbiK family protein [Alphaproteobacteria bacterium]MDE2512770.1 accessory factor UbiK family protein [Alphaproteobacteria bacterium]